MPRLSEGTIMCLHSGEGSASALVQSPLREATPPFIEHQGLLELSLESGIILEGNSLPLGLPEPMLYQGRIWGTVTGCVNAENGPGSGGSADQSTG